MQIVLRTIHHIMNAGVNSVRGLVSTFCHEIAFRQEVALVIPHLLLLYLLDFSVMTWLFLSALLVAVIVLELVNTAIECVVDLVSPAYHELAGRAKDAASAAVGVLLLAYFLSWGVLIALKLNLLR